MKKIPNILFVARDDGGCGFFRCSQPAKFLTRAGLAHAESVLQNPTKEQLLAADLVVMQEMGTVNGSNIARFLIDNKIPYVAEFDDFIQHVSPHNAGGYGSWNPGTLYIHRAMELARAALGITVSTNQLAREYFPYNNNIYVIPNYLDKEKWDNLLIRRQDGKVRIGWCGGNAHADDLYMVSGVIEKIIKEFKGKVLFETMGMTRKELSGVFSLSDFNDSCPSCGYEGQVHHYPGEPLENYPLALGAKGWDIAIAPVINNAFGNCKSDLKLREYSAVGLPIIASAVVPYKEAVENGAPALLATSFGEWYNNIKDLIKHPAKRDELVKAGKEWAEKNWIQDNIYKSFEVYKQLIELGEKTLGKREQKI